MWFVPLLATYCRLSTLSPTLDKCYHSALGKKGKKLKPLWTVNGAFSEHTSLWERCSKWTLLKEGNVLKTVVHLKGQSVLSIRGCLYLHSSPRGEKLFWRSHANLSAFSWCYSCCGTPLERQTLLSLWQWGINVLNTCFFYWFTFRSALQIFSCSRMSGIVALQFSKHCRDILF